MSFAAALPFIGGALDTVADIFNASRQEKLQKKFAQNSIQWRVEDAKKAGIHPIYAMGAQPLNYSPVSVGTDFASMGANLADVVGKGQTHGMKAAAALAERLSLENASLQNDYLRAQIRALDRAGVPPGAGGGGRGPLSAFGISVKPNPLDAPAQAWEDEYGEWADPIGAARLINDAAKGDLPVAFDRLVKSSLIKPDWRTKGIVPGSIADRVLRYFGY